LDGRNLYNPEALREMGMAYQGVGRRNDLVLSFDPALDEMSTVKPPASSTSTHA
jgi:hypothetical protein